MRRRLVLGFVGLSVLLVVALAIPLGALFSHYEHEDASDAAEDRATAMADRFEHAVDAGTVEAFVPVAASGEHVSVVDPTGTLVAGTEVPPAAVQPLVDALGPDGHDITVLTTDGTATIIARAGTTDRLYGAIVYSRSTAVTENRIRAGLLFLGGLGFAVIAVSALLASRLAGWISRPLDELRQVAGELGGGDLSARVEHTRWPPDLQRLGRSFNQMATRIEHLVAQNESFVHEASHQLRTPLTGLRLRLENLAADTDGPPAAELDAATDEVERLSRLTDGLLALARAEQRSSKPGRPTGLGAFLAERVLQWQPLAEEYGIDLVIAAPTSVWVLADEDRLSQIFDNLVANALDASPAGTTITLQVVQDPQFVRLHVIDQGRGMSSDERDRAFERFWRSDDGPASGAGLGGTGLGLPIVARLVAQDGGEIRLDAGPGGVGTDAVVTLQRAAPAR